MLFKKLTLSGVLAIICLIPAFLTAQNSNFSKCSFSIQSHPGVDSLGLSYPFNSCCCEMDYLTISLRGSRINIAQFYPEKGKIKNQLQLFGRVEVSTPNGSFHSYFSPEAFELMENPDPKQVQDDSIFHFLNPIIDLNASTMASPGDYIIELYIYSFVDEFDESILNQLPAPVSKFEGSPNQRISNLVSEWMAKGQLNSEFIHYQFHRKIYHPIEGSRKYENELTEEFRIVFDDCSNYQGGKVILDEVGLVRDENYNPVKEEYIVLGFERRNGPSISSIDLIGINLVELSHLKMKGESVHKKLDETFNLIDQLSHITQYDKYLYKLELLFQFGSATDWDKLVSNESSPCHITPSGMKKSDELIYLTLRQILIEKGLAFSGKRIPDMNWADLIDQLAAKDLKGVADRFFSSQIDLCRELIKLLPPG